VRGTVEQAVRRTYGTDPRVGSLPRQTASAAAPKMSASGQAASQGPRPWHARPGALVPAAMTAVRGLASFAALVVDGRPGARGALTSRLRGAGARTVVQVGSLLEAKARLRREPARDVAVVALTLPDGSGLDLLGELRAAGWRRRVVVVPAEDAATVRLALRLGATGVLVNRSPRLATAPPTPGTQYPQSGYQPARQPGHPVPHRMMAMPAADGMGGQLAPISAVPPVRPSRPTNRLSQREVQVLTQVAEGRTNKEIGADLKLSALTVKSHLARIARKVGTGDRAGMIAVAMRAGVLS
jgi:DNA-binding NarL/FixJ family response regulator